VLLEPHLSNVSELKAFCCLAGMRSCCGPKFHSSYAGSSISSIAPKTISSFFKLAASHEEVLSYVNYCSICHTSYARQNPLRTLLPERWNFLHPSATYTCDLINPALYTSRICNHVLSNRTSRGSSSNIMSILLITSVASHSSRPWIDYNRWFQLGREFFDIRCWSTTANSK
jgi:hypothetical protein